MTEWGVVGVIVVLLGLLGTVTAPMIRLNTTLTKLNDKFDTLDERLTDVSASNHASHRRLWEHEEMQDSKLHDHDSGAWAGLPCEPFHKGGIYMNINWRVRIKNKAFWLALIPAVLLLVQVVAAVFGYTLDLGDLGNKLLAVVNAVFAVLSILGIVTDPTTAGIGDSPQAMTYEEPKQNPYN